MEDMERTSRPRVLYYFEDMTQKEIAVEVGLSVPVRKRRLRG